MSRDETKDDVVRLRRSKRKRRPPRVFSTIPATRRTRFDRRWTIQTLPFDDTDARPTDVPVLFKDASKKIDIAKVIGPCPWNVIDRAYATDRHEWMSKLAKARVTSVRPIEGWATYEAHVRTGKAQTQDEFELPKRREEWPERTAYASLYYDTSDIKDVALSVLPSSLALDKGLTHQIFLSFETTRSLVHFDNTDSILLVTLAQLLYICCGRKTVWLGPPNARDHLDRWSKEFPNWFRYDPFTQTSALWKCVRLSAGDALYLPKNWLHDVDSSKGSIGLSLNVIPAF